MRLTLGGVTVEEHVEQGPPRPIAVEVTVAINATLVHVLSLFDKSDCCHKMQALRAEVGRLTARDVVNAFDFASVPNASHARPQLDQEDLPR